MCSKGKEMQRNKRTGEGRVCKGETSQGILVLGSTPRPHRPLSLKARRPPKASLFQGKTSPGRPHPGIFQGSQAIRGHIFLPWQQAAPRASPEGLG